MKCSFLKSLAFALLISIVPGINSLTAQVPSSPSPEKLQALQDLTDQVKAALQRGDLDAATRFASDLMSGVVRQKHAFTPTPQEKLAKLESVAPPAGVERFYALPKLAQAAFDAAELDKAEHYARELLAAAPEYQKDWYYGNGIFFGNMVLGRVALRRDNNLALAKSSLLASAQMAGSPQLNSFGPNMSLAKDLLTAGERDTVQEFLVLCGKFWKRSQATLDAWTATVKGGGIPDFGANLAY